MEPLSKKSVAFFFAKVIVIYALLIAPLPGVREGYAHAFCAAGNLAFRFFGKEGRARFQLKDPPPINPDAVDWEIKLENIRTHQTGTFEPDRNTRKFGYLQTAFVVALVLATPIPWKRRGWAVLWGVILISAFTGLQVAIHLLNSFSNADALNQFQLGRTSKTLLLVLLKVVVTSPVTAYIAPTLLWIAVTFRREDWATLLPGRRSAPVGALRTAG